MLFNSTQFFVFFPLVTLLYFGIPNRFRNIWLLICSYYFYMCWNPVFILLIVYATSVTYLSAIGISRTSGAIRKAIMVFGIMMDMLILFWFKYFGFVVSTINSVLEHVGLQQISDRYDIILPVGISFFTFQTVSYVVDVYRGDIEAERNLGRYALFVAFFPQLLAGPIERSKDFLKQFKEKHIFEYDLAKKGFILMLWGYFLKLVIADRLKMYVDTVYGDIKQFGGVYLIVAVVFFAFQIYCDFAGYSTIARGAACILGFRLTDNFKAPFFSTSYGELWRRWHVSLSNWFRDYLYIPLGGSRKGIIRKYVNLLVVNAASGLWHGANWTFVVWGMWNGVARCVEDVCAHVFKHCEEWKKPKLVICSIAVIRRFFVLALFASIFVYFRSSSVADAHAVFGSMVSVQNWNILWDGGLYEAGLSAKNFAVALVAIVLLLIIDAYKYRDKDLVGSIVKLPLIVQWGLYMTAIFAVIIFGVYGNGNSSFIYFAF